jgi:D-alanyl-lipoteichoic acid acyltransferase DltB (MBOAT superfamily)
MTFDSVTYIFFLPIVWATYLLLRHRGQNTWLLAASYLFYGWWDIRLLSLIVLSTATDYCWALLISRDRVTRGQYLTAAGSFLAAFGFFVVMPSTLGWIGLANALPIDPLAAFAGLSLATALIPILHRSLRASDPARRKKAYLVISLSSNLAMLGVFKYFNFFIDSAEAVASRLGMTNVDLLHLDIILPVGISFYTFQTMSYVIDVYRGKARETDDYLSFSLFVAYFPQLVAGPIERASHLLPAILNARRITIEGISSGAYLIALGLFKKIAVANGLADSVNSVYGSSGQVTGVDVAVATFFFAIQIYCDFSGYSDIARGTSKLFGIDLMRNFEQPYFSANPSEFWRRWHISLSTWLRDYLYISLGGNREGSRKTYRNLMITMLLGATSPPP